MILVGRVFTNGPGDLGSSPAHIIPKTLKIVLDTSLLNTQQYKVRIKGKVEQSWERSYTHYTPQCCSYWQGSLRVTLNYSCQLTYFHTPNYYHMYVWPYFPGVMSYNFIIQQTFLPALCQIKLIWVNISVCACTYTRIWTCILIHIYIRNLYNYAHIYYN